jgi:hypothetical protein
MLMTSRSTTPPDMTRLAETDLTEIDVRGFVAGCDELHERYGIRPWTKAKDSACHIAPRLRPLSRLL